MARWLAALAFALAALAGVGAANAETAGPFANWAAVVVSGDFHAAHTNNPTETFDNARRDVSAELIRKGFSPANLREFSVRPQLYPDTHPGKADLEPIYHALTDLAQHATAGCLVYFSSHGAPQGVVLDGQILPPQLMDQMISSACGQRPTIVIISACFSGVFVPALADNNRMILTAARPDRSSFGCSESDKYPYFDACMLKVLPTAHDFETLGPAVQACVAQKEVETGMRPPSEPQFFVGPGLRPILPLMALKPDGRPTG
ncbi:MAG TPA: C13 family peptidase [Caulobacteraceae bacterium]|nr:C13 family peptidase [Caulobacteraceae bacterium]